MAVLSSGGLHCGKTSAHNTIVSNNFLQSAKPVLLRLEQRGNASRIMAIAVLLEREVAFAFLEPGTTKNPYTLSFELLLLLLPGLLTFAIGMLWYKACEMNHFATGTSFQGLSFRMNASVWNLTSLVCINGLIILFTLGFGQPFAQLRTFRYFCKHLTVMGEINVDWVQQSHEEKPSLGEGLADAFDLGAV